MEEFIQNSGNRFHFWKSFINFNVIKNMLEVGVWKGEFAKHILGKCSSVEKYYMIDPWRNLENWNKPSNVDNETFEKIYDEAILETDFSKHKRIVLRGTTKEVIDKIPDNSLDFAYIDGDHTLRGITIDLIKVYPKIKNGGWIGGDDLHNNVFHHGNDYAPTMVFPFALYFSESMGDVFFKTKHNQFLIRKTND